MNEHKEKYKVVIIGCGNIAGGFDTPDSPLILTHAHAINKYHRTMLAGVYDVVPSKAKEFAKKWNTVGFNNPEAMLNQSRPDFVVIASPTEFHNEHLGQVLKYSPQCVICEKPISNELDLTREILDDFKKQNIPILVNFSRRYDITMQRLKRDVYNNKFGDFINSSATYTKGILHNGSHLIDLFRFLFGEVSKIKVLHSNIDYDADDPTIDAFLEFRDGFKTHLIAAREDKYCIFELDLLFEKCRINILSMGFDIEFRRVRNDPVYPNYKILDKPKAKETGYKDALVNLYKNAVNYLENNGDLICSGEEGLLTQTVCKEILEKYTPTEVSYQPF